MIKYHNVLQMPQLPNLMLPGLVPLLLQFLHWMMLITRFLLEK
ncbi:hypothetical protein [Methanobacterium sp.]